MNSGRDWMGEFVAVSPAVWDACREEFTFHDAAFIAAEFPEGEDPVLSFGALVADESWSRVTVLVRLVDVTELVITRPRDWVMRLQSEIVDDARVFRWIDQETGLPMIEAKASRLQIVLPSELLGVVVENG